MRSLAGGHTAGTCQSWDLNLGRLPLETLPLTTALRLAELMHPLAWPVALGDVTPTGSQLLQGEGVGIPERVRDDGRCPLGSPG